MDVSFNELKCKEVVNLSDGKRLGRMCDIIFDVCGTKVLGFVVPGERKLFRASEDVFVPWRNIDKIGEDVILIRLCLENAPVVCRDKKKGGCESDDDFLL